MVDGWTITEAVGQLDPPIPRRELARRLKDVQPTGRVYGRKGRRAAAYPIAAVFLAHAEWVRERARTVDVGNP